MTFLNIGNNTGWMIEDGETDPQQEKEDAIAYATERLLDTLKEVTKIYAEYGNLAMFKTFTDAVDEALRVGSFENFFNDANYEDTGR